MLLKRNIRKALIYYSPLLSVTMIFLLIIINSSFSDMNCEYLFGINLSFVNIILVTYGLSIVLLLASIYLFIYGYKVIRYKYCPPLELPVLVDTTSSKGFICQVKGMCYILTPVVSLYIFYIGHTTYEEFVDGAGTVAQMIQKIEQDCDRK